MAGNLDTKTMHEVTEQTDDGQMTFPQAVERLMAVGVESYLVDFAAGRRTHYLTGGETHTEAMTLKIGGVGAEFSGEKLVEAIRAAQEDTIRYPEFVKRATAAGVIGYWAFLTGRQVVYLGRKGEQHVEKFPGAK
jgi:uncharacterized protein YbcV (DUF1398 family)